MWYMVPEIWSVADRISSFWAIFCPFTPITTWKIKILKKWKIPLEISSFYTSIPKIIIVCYTVPEIMLVIDVIFIGVFFAFTPLTVGKIKIFKKRKKLIYQKLWSHEVWFLRYGAQRTDGRTEKATYRGGCPM